MTIDRPFGLLVARARAGDIEFFTPPSSTLPNLSPTPPPLDQATIEPEALDDAGPEADEAATDEAIAALFPAELDALDAEIADRLSPATLTVLALSLRMT